MHACAGKHTRESSRVIFVYKTSVLKARHTRIINPRREWVLWRSPVISLSRLSRFVVEWERRERKDTESCPLNATLKQPASSEECIITRHKTRNHRPLAASFRTCSWVSCAVVFGQERKRERESCVRGSSHPATASSHRSSTERERKDCCRLASRYSVCGVSYI